jgi:hypothetical protein
VCITIAPPALASGTRDDGSRQKKEMTGTRSSRQTARRYFLREFKDQVYAEWSRRQSTRFADLTSHCVDVCAPGHEHAESTGVAYGCCKGRTDRTTHGSLNNRQLNSKTLAKSSLHWAHSGLVLGKESAAIGEGVNPYAPARWSTNRSMSPFGT